MYNATEYIDLPYAAMLFSVAFVPVWIAIFVIAVALAFIVKVIMAQVRNKAD
jgi:hypothetical protein